MLASGYVYSLGFYFVVYISCLSSSLFPLICALDTYLISKLLGAVLIRGRRLFQKKEKGSCQVLKEDSCVLTLYSNPPPPSQLPPSHHYQNLIYIPNHSKTFNPLELVAHLWSKVRYIADTYHAPYTHNVVYMFVLILLLFLNSYIRLCT